MLTRSLFKPLVTNYFSKTISFVSSSSESVNDLPVNDSMPVKQLFLKKLKVKSLFTFCLQSFRHEKIVTSNLLTKGTSNQHLGSLFIKPNVLKLVNPLNNIETFFIISFNNNSVVPVSLCGKKIAIYNGKLLVPITIKRSLLGFSLRHLVRCKRLGRIIHAASITKIRKK